jgi:hypothetical protein
MCADAPLSSDGVGLKSGIMLRCPHGFRVGAAEMPMAAAGMSIAMFFALPRILHSLIPATQRSSWPGMSL